MWVSVCLKDMATSDCYNLGYRAVVRDWDWDLSNHLESDPGFNAVWFINNLPQILLRSRCSVILKYILILTQHRCLRNDVHSSQTIWSSCWVIRRLGDPFSALWSLMVSANITGIISPDWTLRPWPKWFHAVERSVLYFNLYLNWLGWLEITRVHTQDRVTTVSSAAVILIKPTASEVVGARWNVYL